MILFKNNSENKSYKDILIRYYPKILLKTFLKNDSLIFLRNYLKKSLKKSFKIILEKYLLKII